MNQKSVTAFFLALAVVSFISPFTISAASEPVQMAYVDSQRVVDESIAGQAALQELEKFKNKNEVELAQRAKEIGQMEEELRKKIMNMLTDPAWKRLTDKGHPKVCPVFYYHQLFNVEEAPEIEKQCKGAEIGCVDCKKKCLAVINTYLQPIREKRNDFAQNRSAVEDIIATGSRKAQEVASKTLKQAAGASDGDDLVRAAQHLFDLPAPVEQAEQTAASSPNVAASGVEPVEREESEKRLPQESVSASPGAR